MFYQFVMKETAVEILEIGLKSSPVVDKLTFFPSQIQRLNLPKAERGVLHLLMANGH
jgi:hypothetical protein